MKAFITGGTGFLGRNVVEQLCKLGWQITLLHRSGANLTGLPTENVTFVEGSLFDLALLDKSIDDDTQVVFHIAGDTNLWSVNNDSQYQFNVQATQNLVDVCLAKPIAKFIHTSSISAYGFHNQTIAEESCSNAMDSGVNYLKTKYLGEQVVKDGVLKGLPAVILNPCAIIGKYDNQSWAQLLLMIAENRLPGVPPGEGSYCCVEEVAKAHINAVDKGAVGENYILAGVDHPFIQVVNKIETLLDKPLSQRPLPSWVLRALGWISEKVSFITGKEPDMTPEKALLVTKRVVASSNKAKSQLGYNPNIPLDTMLAKCHLWLQQQGKL